MKRAWPETGTYNSVSTLCPVRSFSTECALNTRLRSGNIDIDIRLMHHLIGEVGLLTGSIPTDHPEMHEEWCQAGRSGVGAKCNMLLKPSRIQVSSRIVIVCGFL